MDSLILASSSPRRIELLKTWGFDVQAVAANVDETARPAEAPRPLVRRLASTKALTIAERYPRRTVLGADTVVAVGEKILGKPGSGEQAREMLQSLSNVRHEVYTGVAVWSGNDNFGLVTVSVAHVTFRPLSREEIDAYVATGEPMDKAGGYAIQGQAGQWVTGLDGEMDIVVGLPRRAVERLMLGIGHGKR